MKYHTLLLYSLCLMGLTACGSEDELTAIPDTMTDCFAPDPNATDAESVLRREFYQTEKCYLLFNDTLRHENMERTSTVTITISPKHWIWDIFWEAVRQ